MLKTRRTPVVVAGLIRRTAVALTAVLLPFVGAAQTVVVGQNEPTLDVPAVQAAVDNGGHVLLVGTFDFGDDGRVLIRNDVKISGKRGSATTTIRRGDWPFYSPMPAKSPPPQPGPKVTIQYLHFEGSKGVAVHLAYTGGTSIHHNRVTGMRGREFAPGQFRRSGVLIGPLDSRPRTNIEITPLLVTGSIEVFDNHFDSTGAEPPTATNAGAVFLAFIDGADVRIEDNTNVGCTRNCIAVFDAIVDSAGNGSIVIADNTIVSDVVFGFTVPGARAPIGIDVGFNFNRSLASDPSAKHVRTLIEGNYVELNGRTSTGIISGMNGAVVEKNTIVVHAVAAATTNPNSTSGGIIVATSHQIVLKNKISGEAWNAIRIGGNVVMPRIHNLVQKNKMKPAKFTAFSSDYLLDVEAAFNTIEGKFGTVIDNGHDNTIDIRKTESSDD